MGGMHPIYVFSCDQKEYTGNGSSYNMPAYVPSEAANDNTHALRLLWDDLQSTSIEVDCKSSHNKRKAWVLSLAASLGT